MLIAHRPLRLADLSRTLTRKDMSVRIVNVDTALLMSYRLCPLMARAFNVLIVARFLQMMKNQWRVKCRKNG